MRNTALIILIVLSVIAGGCSSSPVKTDSLPSEFSLGHHSMVTSKGRGAGQSVHIRLRHPDSNHAVAGGAITINGSAIPQWTTAEETRYYYYQAEGALVFDGSFQILTVSGGPDFPALVDSIRSPNGECLVTYPTITDTLSRSAGAMIRWKPLATDSVALFIRDTSQEIGSRRVVRNLDGHTSSLWVDSSELSLLKPGPILVTVRCSNTRIGRAGHRPYSMTVFASQAVGAWLKN